MNMERGERERGREREREIRREREIKREWEMEREREEGVAVQNVGIWVDGR